MGDIKLKGTGILCNGSSFISSLIYLHYGDQNTLRVGIFMEAIGRSPGQCIMRFLIRRLRSLNRNIQM